MKKELKRIMKKGVALLIALTTVISTISATAATSEKANITFDYCYDSSGNQIRYQKTFSHGGITVGTAGSAKTRIYADGDNAYCIQPGISLHTGDTLEKDASAAWNALSANQKNAVNLVLLYGNQGNASNLSGTGSEKWIATQFLIWEIVTGCRNATAPYARTDSKFYEGICGNGGNSGVSAAYYQIADYMSSHNTIPSFTSGSRSSTAKELEWDGSKYVLKLTDSNKVLSQFSFTSSNSNVKISVSGNTLTITSSIPITDTVSLSAAKKVPTVSSSAKLVAYGDPSLQDVVTGVENTTAVNAYLNVEVPYGHVEIVKDSEDGVVEGLKFQIIGEDINKTVTTGKGGKIKIENLRPGTYTVTELDVERYEPQKVQKVTVTGGKTTTVNFSNILKRGELKVTKTSEDGLVEGVKFRLYGTALSGATVDEYATTDSSGVAHFRNVLISGTEPYVLEEVDTAVRYVIPDKQNIMIKWNEVTSATVTNILKKFKVNVVKADAETKTAQGDGTLAGAKYGIYDGDTLIDTYTTDANGAFTTKYYICGDNWSIREIAPSEGYLLDEKSHHIGAEAKNYTVELNTTSNNVTEQVIKGKISIIKHSDDGSTQIETPEVGAKFQVYLKSAGSYAKSKESERDLLICDENGYAETKSLPYGIYTVHQTEGWEGRELISDFDVFISSDGQVYRYLINNKLFESHLKVVKADKETGKTIPLSGAGFQIYDSNGKLVTMMYTYPTITTINTFYTSPEGYLITPESLPYGNGYTLVEVQAPYGYVLDSTPIPFDILPENAKGEGGYDIVTVTMKDMPQKGKITVHKSGEIFAGVEISGDGVIDKDGNIAEGENIYIPVYEITGMAGAVYEIVVAESADIVTPDGTVRLKKGEVADTITTDKEGNAKSKELYLGKYVVVEKTAPDGMVLNKTPFELELTYAGQEISVTETGTKFYNERQKVEIELEKVLEQNERFGVGNNGEIQRIAFGLYTAEELKAADGSVIPEDGLLEVRFCNIEGKLTFASDLPFGKYYVKELTTDEHYILSDAKYPVEFSYQGQETALVTIQANEGKAIENELIRGSISGLKTDTDGESLAGAQIGLFVMDTEEFAEEQALMSVITEEDGVFTFDNVPYGSYIIREIQSPEGYVLNEALHYVAVTAHKEVIEIKIINKLIIGSIRLTKVDADYPANKLTGAVFALYEDSDGNGEFDAEADLYLGDIPEITEGIYQWDELLYGGYFVIETEAPEGFVLDEQSYYFAIQEDGKIVDVENEAGVGFINQPITGELELTKTDVADGKLLPDAGFRIKDEDGNIVETGYTDENGIATFKLRYGKYTYQEFEAPEGYLIDESEFPFKIKEDGGIIKAEMTNEKAPETPEVKTNKPQSSDAPKTGDDSSIGIWVALAAITGLGAAGYKIVKGRKKKGAEQKSEE